MLVALSFANSTGAAAAGGYPELSPEFILKANPDYILLSDTGSNGGQDAAAVAAFNLAFWRHLRRAYASPRRGRRRG